MVQLCRGFRWVTRLFVVVQTVDSLVAVVIVLPTAEGKGFTMLVLTFLKHALYSRCTGSRGIRDGPLVWCDTNVFFYPEPG